MFPANFVATHEVSEITAGERYAYLEYFGQGSSDPERGISIVDPRDDLFGGQVWLHELFKDYERYITDTYDDDSIDLMLLPIARQFNSQNTRIEVEK